MPEMNSPFSIFHPPSSIFHFPFVIFHFSFFYFHCFSCFSFVIGGQRALANGK